MRLLTLNTHSLMELEYNRKLDVFTNVIVKHKPDVIALQEIMQPIEAKVSQHPFENVGKIPLKTGNHALNIVIRLKELGVNYHLYWLGIKKSYGRFDEGLAILSKKKAQETSIINLSPFDNYFNWKTRKALGVKIDNCWFYSVHMGWWDDAESPFQLEFEKLTRNLPNSEHIWLMGDFNSVASDRDKGYDLIVKSGFFDTYTLAINKDEGITAHNHIDGWKNEKEYEKIRIDYIFISDRINVESSFTIFNGANEPVVSDHFGILVTTGGAK